MPINHSFSILMCNIKLVIKLTLLITIIGLIIYALLSSVITPFAHGIYGVISTSEIDANQLLAHPIITIKTQILDRCVAYIKNTQWRHSLAYVCLIFFAYRLLITVTQLPVTKVLYNKMQSGYDIGLFHAFIATGFQNLLLSVIYSIVYFLTDVGLFLGFGSLLLLSLNSNYIFIPLIIIAYVCVSSARTCIMSQWMPEICASQSKNIFIGLKVSFKCAFKRFFKNFMCFTTLNFVKFTIIASTLLTTFGVIPLISIPVFIVLSCALSLTLNFSYHQQKYFIDNGSTVYNPSKLF